VVGEFVEFFQRNANGQRVEISPHLAADLPLVRLDRALFRQVLLNLALNARDAMPEGGALTITTKNVTLTSPEHTNPGPGRYVTISVQDTGTGMGVDVQEHMFEPFYTTKEIGNGGGLGLATVLGIVEQSGGAIRCDSAAGWGTTFSIFLPAVRTTADKTELVAGELAGAPKGSEVILLVDDEEVVRVLAAKVLKASGYTVYDVNSGLEGLAFCESHAGPIDLLISDVVVPDLEGADLAAGALKLRPDIQVMFMSGNTEDGVLNEGVLKGMSFIQKPFTPLALARKVRETLDIRAAGVTGQLDHIASR
jgi:two-component system cell cycle sensor histidine kinase/response regulator CckA